MDLRQLTTFTAVANERSFTRAALSLNYAQSSVTAQIQALEDELGVPLFDRLGRRVALTEAGRRLQDYAARMLALADETRAAVTESAEPTGTIVIGVVESLCTYRLPTLLRAYRQRYPQVRLLLHTLPLTDPWRGLLDGTMDAGLSLGETQSVPGVIEESLPNEPLVVIAAPEHRLVGAKRVDPLDLENEPVLLTEGACGYRGLFESALSRAGVHPTATLEFGSVEAIKQCVMAGLGIAVLPEMAVHEEIAQGRLVALRWSDPDFAVSSHFVWHKDKWKSPALRAFRDMVHDMLGARAASAH
ncbi:MAG TPA: LysR family transcriptional regulator [Ktedonobacterales bacterium]